MRTKTIKLYSINELSEDAREHALKKYRENQTEIFWSEEIFESLKGLFNACSGVSLKDYSLEQFNSWIKVEFDREESKELTGKRAIAWINNNLLVNIRIPENSLSDKGKRSELAKYGRYYRAGEIKPCPFTGYCADDDFLDSLLKDVKEGTDLKTAFEGLATEYQRILNDEIDYQNSEEYIIEHMEINEYEFTEDGERG